MLVSFTDRVVHLELVSELTTAALIATWQRFMAGCGKPIVIWSDHGTNLVGVVKEIKELYSLLRKMKQMIKLLISAPCKTYIQWCYTP